MPTWRQVNKDAWYSALIGALTSAELDLSSSALRSVGPKRLAKELADETAARLEAGENGPWPEKRYKTEDEGFAKHETKEYTEFADRFIRQAQDDTTKHIVLPEHDAQLKHIFSGKEGHLNDTPENRALLYNLSNRAGCFAGTDKYGNSWNVEMNRDGSQTWVRYQNGVINEGGLNHAPRTWNGETGLNHPGKR